MRSGTWKPPKRRERAAAISLAAALGSATVVTQTVADAVATDGQKLTLGDTTLTP
jgi:hypothetical protein